MVPIPSGAERPPAARPRGGPGPAPDSAQSRRLAAIALALAAVVFALDLVTPMGVAGGIPHVAVVVCTLWLPGRRSTLAFAALATLLTAAGGMSASDVPLAHVASNGALTAFALWTTAGLVLLRKHSDIELAHSERKYAELYDHAPDMFVSVDAATKRIARCNGALLELTGYAREEVVGRRLQDLCHADSLARFHAAVQTFESTGRVRDVELQLLLADGSRREVSVNVSAIRDARGRVVESLSIWRDITPRKRAERALRRAKRDLERQANLDPLTGAPNRRRMERILTLENQRRAGEPLVAILADCDDFKRINDRYGHGVGDAVLQELTSRLSSSLRPTDVLGRIGGDEFLILLRDTSLEEAARVAERVRLVVAATGLAISASSNRPEAVTVSLGVAEVPRHAVSIEEILALTHHALALSKDQGKNRVCVQGEARSELHALDRLPDSLLSCLASCDGIGTRAQPIVELESGRIVAYELLSRGPQGPLESPIDLFRVSNERHMLTPVDLKCLKTCVARGRSAGAPLRFHVNLFPSTVLDAPVEELAALLAPGPGGESFCIELNEQQFVSNSAELVVRLRRLRARGIAIGCDDVGFGHSSLESLVAIQPDVVKIDRRIIHGIARDPDRRRDLERLLRVVRGLDAQLIAEGIERAADRDLLIELGVRLGQGFLWGRPTLELEPAPSIPG